METRSRNRRRTQARAVLKTEDRETKRQNKSVSGLSARTSKRRKRKRKKWRAGLLAFFTVLAAVYCAFSFKYRTVFLPNTTIGKISVAEMTVDEVKEEIRKEIEGYQLTLEERNGQEEFIYGREIGLTPVYDDYLEKILQNQNPLMWGVCLGKGTSYEQNCMVTYDEDRLKEAVSGLACLKPENITEPVSAHLAFDDGGLTIVPEERGNRPDPKRLLEAAGAAAASLTPRISLDALGIYQEPEVLQDSEELLKQKEKWKDYANVKVTYHFGSQTEVVDGNLVCSWLIEDNSGNVMVDRTRVEEYVKGLAKKYNTAYCTKMLKTSYGPTVKITQGHYGWIIDQKTEVENLMLAIESGGRQEREPAYLQTAATHDGPDYGDTYVEINLTAQHLFYYKDGKLLIESDFVSGNEAKGWSTPAGVYELTYKQKNATLKGANYKTPVTYWMPFNGNIGMHDGYWRSSFGGTIYKRNGSHGCVNLPPAVAKTIFENIEKGIPVICYHLKGTETDQTTIYDSGKAKTSKGKEMEMETAPSAPAPAAVPAETAPAATTSAPAPDETAAPSDEYIIPKEENGQAEANYDAGGSLNLKEGPGMIPEKEAEAIQQGPGETKDPADGPLPRA